MPSQNGDASVHRARPMSARVSQSDVVAWMREHLARLLGVAPDDLDPHENFLDLGVDSVQAMALLEVLATALHEQFAPEVFFDHPTLTALSDHLLGAYPEQIGHLVQAAQRERAASPASLPSLPELPNEPTLPATASNGHDGHAPAAQPVQAGAPGQRPSKTIDIAIIGMAGRFPGASDLDRYWANMRDGVDAITDVPKDRWDIDAIYDPDPRAPGKSYLRKGGFLDDVYSFSPLFFHLSPREAAFIDPQQRLFMEIAWETIEGAGYGGASLRGSRTGVYVGVSSGEFLHSMITRQCEMASYVGTGNSPSIIPNRISYYLNLRGPSLALDTACSSSLVAIQLACESLARGETDYALAGAVALTLHHGKWVYFSKAGMLAADGHCKTFDAGANGYVPGEGVAAVLLKPLHAALRDRDTVHGVIRGIAVNQDGRTNGITAPSPRAQRELCQEVYERFEIDPSTISYVEAHGTGTPLGDPIEVSALTQAFGQFTDRKQFCGIGSVKTSIGHLEPVAGVAGLCKVLLSMRHRQLPPTLHFNEVNPHIHFAETPFYLVDRLQPWHSDGPRRATVSAFSFGGVNAHMVVEEPPAAVASPVRGQPRDVEVVTLAATSDTALAAMARRLDEHLEGNPALALADVAFTLNVGREHFDRRLGLVADSIAGLRRDLRRAPDLIASLGAASDGRRRRKVRQPAFAFGGGAADPQTVRTAALLLASEYPQASALFDEAQTLVGALTPGATLLTFQVALARLWMRWGLEPQAVTGAGTDGIAAAIVAGACTFEAGLRQAQAGARSVVADGAGTVPIQPAGSLTEDDYVVIPVEPGQATLRHLAQIAAGAFQAGLELDWQAWHDGTPAGRVPLPTYPFERQRILPPATNPELLQQAALGKAHAGSSLPGETATVEPPAATRPHAVRIEHRNGSAQTGQVDLVLTDAEGRVLSRFSNVALTGDFVALGNGTNGAAAQSPSLPPLPDGVLHEIRWRPSPLPAGGVVPAGCYVVFVEDAASEAVAQALAAAGGSVVRVTPGPEFAEDGADRFQLNPFAPGDHDGLVVTLQERGLKPTFVHLWACEPRRDILGEADAVESRLARGPYSVFALIRAISRRRLGGPPALFVGSTDGQPAAAGVVRPEHAALFGLMRSISQEYAQLRTVHIDLSSDEPPAQVAAAVLGEVAGGGQDRSVAYRDGTRLAPELAALDPAPAADGIRLREGGVYWITGGLGGIGRLLARSLAERYRARLVLSGRTVPPRRDRWDAYLSGASIDDPMARAIRDIQGIEAAGGEILILDVDVSETWQTRRALRQILERFGALHGVFHAAGVVRDSLIRSKDLATFREVLRPKIQGTLCLERALEGQPLDFLALFSSVAAIAGNIAQSDYSTANAFLDGLAWSRRTQGRPYVTLNWSLWESGGMGTSDFIQDAARTRGIVPIPSTVGVHALERALALGLPQVVIGQFEQKAMQRGLPATGVPRESTGRPTTVSSSQTGTPERQMAAPPTSHAAPAPAPEVTGPPPPASTSVPDVPPATFVPVAPVGAPPAPVAAAVPEEAGAADADLREFAEDWLLGLLGPRLGVATSDIDPETPFLDLGIDSIIAGEVALDAGSQLPVALSPTMLLDYPTITDLAAFLCDRHPGDVQVLRHALGKGPAPGAAPTVLAAATPAAPALDAPAAIGTSMATPPAAPSASANGHAAAPPIFEAPAPQAVPAEVPVLLTLSAESEAALGQRLADLRAAVQTPDGRSLDQMGRALGRSDQPHRAAIVARSREDLAQKLAAPVQTVGVVSGMNRPKIAFTFTGQGAQYQRMAERLYQTEPIFRQTLDRCDAILGPHLDRPLLELLFPADGRPRPLEQTVYTQPLTFALDYALAQLWRAWGIEPDAVIGHSVGEYAAACVAGVFSLEDGLPLIAQRARLMQELPAGGGMLAVRADEATARRHVRIGSRVSVAALNSPSSVVLSGDAAQLDAIAAALREDGVQSVRLGVSHAFHSALMEPVLAPFERCFAGVRLQAPRIPLISNVTGRPATGDIVDPEYWLRQLRQPVRFSEGIRSLAAAGITVFLEVGPAATLTGLTRETVEAIGTMGDRPLMLSSLVRGRDDREAILAALAEVWVRGASVSWAAVDAVLGDPSAVDGAPYTTRPAAPRTNGRAHEAAPAASSPPSDVPLPNILFESRIDHARVSDALRGLREGTMSVSEVLARVRSSTGGGAEGDR
ncbi:MAG: SDR family NAD(P)-dependent oxidoreductase [Chloroflexi bacterium]|nr:SDR family NAD(P)-dependent oxidoreductase [Chloroflexota bacterium]